MATNKVIYHGVVLIDLTETTVTPETLAVGATAIDASGQKITGTYDPVSELPVYSGQYEEITT